MARRYFPNKHTLTAGMDSKSEERVAAHLEGLGIEILREPVRVPFVESRHYLPDFQLPNGIYIEVKGLFLPEDRTKHLLVREQNPDLDVRFVFDNSKKTLSPSSKTSYAAWCEKKGFLYADKYVPESWVHESPKTKDTK